MWSQLHHCDGLFQNRQWHKHIDDLLDDSIWDMLLARELRLQTTVFAGVVRLSTEIRALLCDFIAHLLQALTCVTTVFWTF